MIRVIMVSNFPEMAERSEWMVARVSRSVSIEVSFWLAVSRSESTLAELDEMEARFSESEAFLALSE